MPDITNPQIIAFANERVRTIADKVTELRYAIDSYLNDYAAQGMAALIVTAGGANTIPETSGRSIITGTQILNQKAAILKLQPNFEADLVSGVGATVAAINDAIQVNGSPR